MSIELAEKIKAWAKSVSDTAEKIAALEARVKSLEAGMPEVIPESIVKRVVEQMRDRIPVVAQSATTPIGVGSVATPIGVSSVATPIGVSSVATPVGVSSVSTEVAKPKKGWPKGKLRKVA